MPISESVAVRGDLAGDHRDLLREAANSGGVMGVGVCAEAGEEFGRCFEDLGCGRQDTVCGSHKLGQSSRGVLTVLGVPDSLSEVRDLSAERQVVECHLV
ncbi:hypothetical protein ACFRJ1_02520 [Streptomyces sp. NPDC056773]|uniref:hypothetical protein n=1 Tax=unclassified Streptomyces TaxID=2593676 RepID=UPI0036C13258